jgi:hypothetical protein
MYLLWPYLASCDLALHYVTWVHPSRLHPWDHPLKSFRVSPVSAVTNHSQHAAREDLTSHSCPQHTMAVAC